MIKTQEITLNMGPQHPSTHGVFHLLLKMDHEVITEATPICGYLHRGIEKLAEARTYTQVIPYTDRLDYLSSMLNNTGYCMALEKLMGVEVPERAEFIRVICNEISRIASHLVAIGTYSVDIGGITGFMYCLRDREYALDLLEEICGSRMTFSFMRIGGVSEDVPDGWLDKVIKFVDYMPACIDEYDGLITGNEIFQARTKQVGIIPPDVAVNYSMSGPNLRGSGVNWDLRKTRPYSVYNRLEFDVPLGKNGDCFDRFVCRMIEMRQSLRIIRQAVEQMPEGPVMGKVPKMIKPPAGDAYLEIEGAKGMLGYYVVSDGSNKPYRVHVRRPSYINLGYLNDLCKGWKIADVVAILGSLDIVLGEVDC